MQATELYKHLLGLEKPWFVSDIKLNIKEQRIDVWVDHPKGMTWPCPSCGHEHSLYDHTDERVWRHLDSCQFMTYLHASPPRVQCPDHGIHQVILPWAEARSRFTALFEWLAIEVLLHTDVKGASQILRITWDEAWHLMERAVERGLKVKESSIHNHLGVDEKAVAKGHEYITLVNDLDQGVVDYIGDGRTKDTLNKYFLGLTPEQLISIQAIAMDMWEPYAQAMREKVPDPENKLVHDPYHIMSHIGQAVDKVRRQESRSFQSTEVNPLTGSKYFWLYAEVNLPEKHRERFEQLKKLDLKTGRAWAIKESFRHFWQCADLESAIQYWRKWFFWATHSRLKPIIEVAKMIHRHRQNVLTYFTHRITNAVSEGINSKIQTIQKRAYGIRNRKHLKIAIYFYCGGLSLYPSTHTIVG